jgi:CheY-like chemotaxis protein
VPKQKRVLDVGQCRADHGAIRRLVRNATGAGVERATTINEAIQALQADRFDLVLVNRVLARDRTSGLDLIGRIKGDSALRDTPVMLISNYDDAQEAAVEIGALRGFGKDHLKDAAVAERLREALGQA